MIRGSCDADGDGVPTDLNVAPASREETMEDDRNRVRASADPYCGCSKPRSDGRSPLIRRGSFADDVRIPDPDPSVDGWSIQPREYASQVHQYPRVMKPVRIRRAEPYVSPRNLEGEPWVDHPYVDGAHIKRYGRVWQSLHNQVQQAASAHRPAPAWMGDFYRDSFDESRVYYCGCSKKREDFASTMDRVTSGMRNMDLRGLSSLPPRGKRQVMV
jgi:hypothetical protein